MSSDRLEAIHAELKSILDERIAELKKTISEDEELTRQIVAAETEIARGRHYREGLQHERNRIAEDVQSLSARHTELKADVDSRGKERDELRQHVETLRVSVGKLESEVRALRDESVNLEKIVDRLEKERAQLQEHVDSVRKHREEQRRKIVDLQAKFKELSEAE